MSARVAASLACCAALAMHGVASAQAQPAGPQGSGAGANNGAAQPTVAAPSAVARAAEECNIALRGHRFVPFPDEAFANAADAESVRSRCTEHLVTSLGADIHVAPAVAAAGAASVATTAPNQVISDSPGTQGSPAQTEAVPSAMPNPATGAAVALASTRAGPRLLAAFSVNPLGLGAATPNTMRYLDLAVQLPVNAFSSPTTPAPTTFDYWGIRARINVFPLISPHAVDQWRVLRESLRNRRAARQTLDEQMKQILEGLDSLEERAECAAHIRSRFGVDGGAATAVGSCDPERLTSFVNDVEAARSRAASSIAQARAEADPAYLGFDLRMDVGDASFTGNAAARDNVAVLASVAGGYRAMVRGSASFAEFRGRLGYAYTWTPGAAGGTETHSLDWAVGVSYNLLRDGSRPIALSAGLEGRWAPSDVDAANPLTDARRTLFRLGFTLPVPNSAGLSIGISKRLDDPEAAAITLGGDWSLLSTLLGASGT